MKNIVFLMMLMLPATTSAHVGSHAHMSLLEMFSHFMSETGSGLLTVMIVVLVYFISKKIKR